MLPALLLFAAYSAQAEVKVEGGLLQGVVENGLTVYKGIPFAAAPTGDFRRKFPPGKTCW